MTDPIQTAIKLFDNLQRLMDGGATQDQIYRFCAESKAKLESLTVGDESVVSDR